jgi:hypothetical protein
MDTSGSCVDIVIWVLVESNLGILCACIPMLGPCFKACWMSSAVSHLRGWISTYGRKPSGTGTFYESKSLPPLPGTLEEGYSVKNSNHTVDVNGNVERILRLGHMWELDARVALSQVGPEGVWSRGES